MHSPNPQQQRAMQSRNADLILSAAAGAGKTAVMVERAAQLVLEGCDVERILMVTFTNASAAEMKERIKRVLAQSLTSAQEPAVQHRLRANISKLDSADICTVHAFCIRLVREYFEIAGVDPLFRMAGASETAMLQSDAMDELFDQRFAEQAQDTQYLMNALANGNERSLRELVLATYDSARTSPDPDGWLQRAAQTYHESMDYTPLIEQAHADLAKMAAALEQAAEWLREAAPGMDEKSATKLLLLANTYASMAGQVQAITAEQASEQTLEALTSLSFPTLSLPKGMDERAKAFIKRQVDRAKDIRKQAQQNLVFDPGIDECQRRHKAMARATDLLCGMVQQFSGLYSQRKQEQDILDFSDAEHYALKVLSHPGTLEAISARYDAVFVDEYQDTNDLQEAVITRVARPGTLFCVGDVKQSIYAFRYAEPSIFMHRYDQSSDDEAAARQRIDLNLNYRSTQSILEAVNDVFSHAMTRACGGVDYDDAQRLNVGRTDGQGTSAELHLIVKDFTDEESNLKLQNAQAEAIICAQRIEQLLGETFTKDGQEVRYQYQDIAILLRSFGDWGSRFMDTLAAAGIPAVGGSQQDFFAETEINAVLCILSLLDNARDDLALIGALRGPACDLAASDLALIRLENRDVPLYEAAQACAEQDTPLGQALRAFFARMQAWQQRSRTLPLHELVADIIDSTEMPVRYALLPGGEARVARLNKLVERAHEFSTYTRGGIGAFLRMVELLRQGGGERDSLPLSPSNAVRIMTVHGSKGLEFPAVILAGSARAFNMRDSQGVVLDKNMGIGLPYYDETLGSRSETALRMHMAQAKQRSTRAEEMRVLYVALTRAREKLIVTGIEKSSALEGMLAKAPDEASTPMDWLLPALLRTRSGQELADFFGLEHAPQNNHVHWAVALHPLPGLHMQDEVQAADWDTFVQTNATRERDAICQALDWVYPYQAAVDVPSKMAASQIGEEQAEAELERPAFMAETTGYTSAEAGSIMHRAMMFIDLQKATDAQAVSAQIDALVHSGRMLPEQAAQIDAGLIARFAGSELAERIRSADTVLREQPFNLVVQANELVPGGGDDNALVQGIIDLAFIEQNAWVLVDYKTNRLGEGGVETIKQLYANQMRMYARALTAITGRPVREAWVSLLRYGLNVPMDIGG